MSTVPAAINDFYTVVENSNTNFITPRDNDFIPISNPAQYRIQSLPALGTLLVSVTNGDPFITPTLNTPYDGPMHYTPDPDVTGTDQFTYDLINNIAEVSNVGVVTFTIAQERPTGPVSWATQLLNNGPLGGPNRIDPSVDRQEAGWAWGDKPDYETLNGWKYNVGQLLIWAADAIERVEGDIQNVAETPDATELVKGKARIGTQNEANSFATGNLILATDKLPDAWNTLFGGFSNTGKQKQLTSGSLDTILTNSVFSLDAGSVAGAPTSAAGDWYFVRTFGYASDDFAAQEAYGLAGATAVNTRWYRTRTAGTWGSWFSVSVTGAGAGNLVIDTWITATVSGTIVTVVGSENITLNRTAKGKYSITYGVAMSDLTHILDYSIGSEGNAERAICIEDGTKTINGCSFLITGLQDGAQQDPSLIDIKVSRRL